MDIIDIITRTVIIAHTIVEHIIAHIITGRGTDDIIIEGRIGRDITIIMDTITLDITIRVMAGRIPLWLAGDTIGLTQDIMDGAGATAMMTTKPIGVRSFR